MTEVQSVKVYELAKELDTDSISLLDRLKGLGIDVKSHMSELTVEQVVAAKTALAPKKTSSSKKGASSGKTAPVRKRTAAPQPPLSALDTTVPAAPKKASVTRKAAAPTTKTQETAQATTAAAAVAAPAADDANRARSTVIRRRKVETTEGETTTQSTLIRKGEGDSIPEMTDITARPPSQMDDADAESISGDEFATSEPAPGPEEGENLEEVFGLGSHAEAKPSAPQVRLNFSSGIKVESRLKVISKGGPVPPPSGSKTPRPATGQKPAFTTTPASVAGKGGRIIRVTNENIDQMAEEEAKRKKHGAERGVKPEDVHFADYRKKEVVYLGKKKKIAPTRELQRTQITTAASHKRVVRMTDLISAQDLANQMSVKVGQVIKKLISMGQMITANQAVDFDTATLLANEFGFECKNVKFDEASILGTIEAESTETLVTRPPVVTVMGHVDHGKTSILDAIRKTDVAAGEAGGITQHIGAYTVTMNGKPITFIDTPGHAAFTAMRARGAGVTDIVILVVAADDGVMPQTRESVSHAKAAGVPIVVAVNKIDKPDANPDRVKQGLSEIGLLPEEWGGDTMFVSVSAIQKKGIDKLLESVLLNAEMLDLKANPNTRAEGVVLEARLEKGRGPVATFLVKKGSLQRGDIVVAGAYMGRVRAMVDHTGAQVQITQPGMAAEILGMEGVPAAGDAFHAVTDDADAKRLIDHRLEQERLRASAPKEKMTLEDLFAKVQKSGVKELKVVLKTDVFGSLEAIRDSLTKLSTDKVKVNVIHVGTGGITESDVLLASASDAIIIGFNVRPETTARRTAEQEGIEVKCYSIIYELFDDVKKAMGGLLDKKKVETFLGRAEVRNTFNIPKVGLIAGCSVVDGKIVRNAGVRLLRDSRIIWEGKLSSLKRFKDDAREVASGYECGIGLENYNDVKVGDIIEAFEIKMIAQELEQAL